jgi:eukaryotic translation initiation factor 2C
METGGNNSRREAEKMHLPDSFVAPDASSMTPMQVTCQRPPGRDDYTFRTVSRNAYKQDLYVQEFGISISNRLANVEARTLPFPRLKYHDSSWEECIPSIGQRNMMHKKVVHGGIVRL